MAKKMRKKTWDLGDGQKVQIVLNPGPGGFADQFGGSIKDIGDFQVAGVVGPVPAPLTGDPKTTVPPAPVVPTVPVGGSVPDLAPISSLPTPVRSRGWLKGVVVALVAMLVIAAAAWRLGDGESARPMAKKPTPASAPVLVGEPQPISDEVETNRESEVVETKSEPAVRLTGPEPLVEVRVPSAPKLPGSGEIERNLTSIERNLVPTDEELTRLRHEEAPPCACCPCHKGKPSKQHFQCCRRLRGIGRVISNIGRVILHPLRQEK